MDHDSAAPDPRGHLAHPPRAVPVPPLPLAGPGSLMWVSPDEAAPEAARSLAAPSPAATLSESRATGFFLSGLKFGIVLVLAWGLFFNFSEVRGSSMMPGIQDHDRILVDHVSYMFASVHRGDIVVLRYPLDPTLDYIKRVVAVPGDVVDIIDGVVWVNGLPIVEPYVDQRALDKTERIHLRVRPGHYYVLGDNRIRSSDSREFGQVPHEFLRGKVRVRLWPLGRLGLID